MEHWENAQNNSEMVIYTTADGLTKIETTMTRQRLNTKNTRHGRSAGLSGIISTQFNYWSKKQAKREADSYVQAYGCQCV